MLNKLQFQNLAELQLQNLDQPLCSKSEGPNVSSQICNKVLPTWSSLSTSATVTTSTSFELSTSATVTTSTSFELATSHARVTSMKSTKRQLVSLHHSQTSILLNFSKGHGVGEWVGDKGRHLDKDQGCIICSILPSGMGACGVSSEHMENMEMFSCSPT